MSMIVRRLAKDRRNWGQRIILVVDARVIRHALMRGRSASRLINRALRRLLPFLALTGLRILVIWVPTDVNAADDRTRGWPTRAARPREDEVRDSLQRFADANPRVLRMVQARGHAPVDELLRTSPAPAAPASPAADSSSVTAAGPDVLPLEVRLHGQRPGGEGSAEYDVQHPVVTDFIAEERTSGSLNPSRSLGPSSSLGPPCSLGPSRACSPPAQMTLRTSACDCNSVNSTWLWPLCRDARSLSCCTFPAVLRGRCATPWEEDGAEQRQCRRRPRTSS